MSDNNLPPKEERVYGKVTTMAELMQQASVVKKRPRTKPVEKQVATPAKGTVENPLSMEEAVKLTQQGKFKPAVRNYAGNSQPKPRKQEKIIVSDNWLLELKASLERNNAN